MNVYYDCESYLITPGCQAPPIVCGQFATDTSDPVLVHVKDLKPLVEQWLKGDTIVGHSVAYDLACIAAQWPELIPDIFRAYAEDRVTDTMVRQKLIDIGRGRQKDDKKLRYDLGSVSLRCDGPVLDKEDPYRLLYGTLYGQPVEQWPEAARAYALKDAEATRAVYLAQEKHTEYLADQFRQARAAWWIRLMECWGIKTSQTNAEKYIERVCLQLEEDTKTAQQSGLVRANGTRDLKAAQAWMRRICEEQGETVPLTETGQVSLSEETIDEFGDDVMNAYAGYANAKTRRGRAERLLVAAQAGVPIQASFNVLVNTGRTSCSQGDTKKGKTPTAFGAQIQNFSKDKGYREVFVPRDGYTIVSIDYDALELRTWAQCCIWQFGFSKLADALNANRDPHTELGAQLAGVSVEKAYELKKTSNEFNNGPRFFAKKGNFTFPGGGGAARFIVSLVKDAVHYGDPELIRRARAYTEPEAKKLKTAWLQTWPEAPRWFDWATRVIGKADYGTFTHYHSARVRAGMTFCQLCNSPFQGLGADIKKAAFFQISRECYDRTQDSPLFGSRLVDDVHDEALLECPLNTLHEAAYRARDIMTQTAMKIAPDLIFTAEPAAMTALSKNAKTLKDAKGRLIPDTIVIL